MTKKALLLAVRKGSIPVLRINSRVFRFHPRTILATQRTGVSK
jgi:hypothetical protein